MCVQAANDTNVQADREAIQKELTTLADEIDTIGRDPKFNTKKLFDGSLETSASPFTTIRKNTEPLLPTLHIYFAENDYTTIQSNSGDPTMSGYNELKNTLKNSIVPQAVTSLVSTYSDAFGYLQDSSIGIGLNLYSNINSSTLASVALGLSGKSVNGVMEFQLDYKLSVNMAYLSFESDGTTLTESCRSELEATILHEMVHALMDESLTCGMLGFTNSGTSDTSNEYPLWFAEGMAQTASGGYADWNDWVDGLGINASTPINTISSNVQSSTNKLSASTSSSAYGTGYLACMYLGFLGSGASLSQGNVTAANIKSGLNLVLKELVNGKSLDTVINEVSGGIYSSTKDFENKFGDSNSATFISYLTQNVGSGNGSLVTGNFASTDLLSNDDTSTDLFKLNTNTTTVSNVYPSDVTVLSGGGTTLSGVPAVTGGTGGTGGTSGTGGTGGAGALMIQAGANSYQSIAINIQQMNASKLGIRNLSVMNHYDASNSITLCDNAITQISEMRSNIGAHQNRLEHAITNPDNTAENLQVAESRIRDLNIADGIMEYSKEQIIMQAGQAMLAQTNKRSNGILSLLQ